MHNPATPDPARPETIHEPGRELPVIAEVDVLVVGGGIAGVAAAVAAQRNNASVILLERTMALGGLATLGNVIIYLPLCDGMGNQVISGIGEELLRLSVRDIRSPAPDMRVKPIPAPWLPGGNPEERAAERYRAEFNSASLLLALEEFILQEGIALQYDTRCCAAVRENNMITALIVENKSGRSAIRCKTVIDASGDADVCALAEEPVASLDANVLAGWFYYCHGREIRLKVISNRYSANCTRDNAEGPFFIGDNADDVTGHLIQSRNLIREFMTGEQRANPHDNILPLNVPTIPDLRMTRRLKGELELEEKHERCYFPDSIGMTGDWRKSGPVYYLPLRCLTGVNNRNLLTAGRCISTGNSTWDMARVIPTCAVTGQAAGTAAAMACERTGGEIRQLDIQNLQERLTGQGVILDRKFATGQ